MQACVKMLPLTLGEKVGAIAGLGAEEWCAERAGFGAWVEDSSGASQHNPGEIEW